MALPYGNVNHMPLYITQCTNAQCNHADIFNSMLVTASKDHQPHVWHCEQKCIFSSHFKLSLSFKGLVLCRDSTVIH